MRNILVCLFISLNLCLIAQTTTTGSIISNGLTRSYRLYVPQIYNAAQPVPLILNLHGYGSNALEQEFYGDFRPIADTANFILVAPNGTLDNGGSQFWSAFGLGGVDDVAFLSDLIDQISSQYNIDQNRIYSTGMSNGGFMSYELACQLSHRIAAIASVTGSMSVLQTANCNCSHPMPVMQIHGTADAVVPYNGSFGVLGIGELMAFWVNFNNCSTIPVLTEIPNINTTDMSTAENYLYAGGAQSSTVELYKIIGGGHSWPGAIINLNVTNQDFMASKEIWRFFRQFRLDQLTQVSEQNESTAGTKCFPNPSNSGFYIQCRQPGTKELNIYDTYGKLVYSNTTTDEILFWNPQCEGVFTALVASNGKSYSHRLVSVR